MKIIDYDQKYLTEIYELQKNQWGEGSDTDEIFNNIDNYYINIAIDNNELIGVSIFHFELDKKIISKNDLQNLNKNFNGTKNELSCLADFIIIKEEYQAKGIGTKFLEHIINFSKENNCKFIECEAIGVYGKINSKKLLEKFNFKLEEIFENYWGKKCPNFFCKECNHKPCVCSMNKFKKFL